MTETTPASGESTAPASGTTSSDANASTALDEQAAAGSPEVSAPGQADSPESMPTAAATAQGSADPGPASGIFLGERGVVGLPVAPMPQFEMARAAGAEPVYPEGLEDLLSGETDLASAQEDVSAVNPAILEAVEARAGENAVPTMAGSSGDSSVVATGGDDDVSHPQTGAPAVSGSSGSTVTGDPATQPAASTDPAASSGTSTPTSTGDSTASSTSTSDQTTNPPSGNPSDAPAGDTSQVAAGGTDPQTSDSSSTTDSSSSS